jgi:hypothetical protein
MTKNKSRRFSAPYFDRLEPDTLSFRVPVIDGAIQIGVGRAIERESITMVHSPGHIAVTRDDGSPIQIEVLRARSKLAKDGSQFERVPVFEEPVEGLEFYQTSKRLGRGVCWFATGEGLSIANTSALRSFTNILGVFALDKQGTPINFC